MSDDVYTEVPAPPPPAAQVVALWAIFLLLLVLALYVARSIVLPVAVAVLVAMVLAPVMRGLVRAGVPAALGAVLILLVLCGAAGWGTVALTGPATEWVQRAPEGTREIERKLRFLREPVARVNEATEQMEKATRLPASGSAPTVVLQQARLSDILLDQTQGFLTGLAMPAVLLFFLLSSPDSFLEKAVELAPRLQDKKRVVSAVREVESEVSSYLLTTTAIHLVFGALVAAARWGLGVPNAALWGVLAAITNFVPYVGAAGMALVLGAVGVLSFDEPGRMFLPAGAFLVLNLFEANLVTPAILGRRLTLSPVVVLVWVVLWSWLWGIPGGLIAVPMLAALKIVFQHVPALSPVAKLIE